MGGKGSGRKPSEESIVNGFYEKHQPVVSTVSDNLALPNYSGMQDQLTQGYFKVKVNDLSNPDGDTDINMSNKLLGFRYTSPTPAGEFAGAFEVEATGGFAGDLVHIHQHTGNPSSVNLLKLECEDADVVPLHAISAGARFEFHGGDLDVNSQKVVNVANNPSDGQDAANKNYVDAGDLWNVGTGDMRMDTAYDLDMQAKQITEMAEPTDASGAATKYYVDNASSASPLTTKGDLYTYDTADARLPVGSDGAFLVADSSESLGIKWSGRSVTSETFDVTSPTAIATSGSFILNITAIAFHNNDSTSANDENIELLDGYAGTSLYGGGTGNIYLMGRGGFFGLPMSSQNPWFTLTSGKALWLSGASGRRIAGTVWYYTS